MKNMKIVTDGKRAYLVKQDIKVGDTEFENPMYIDNCEVIEVSKGVYKDTKREFYFYDDVRKAQMYARANNLKYFMGVKLKRRYHA